MTNDLISRSTLLVEIDNERRRHIDSGNYGAEHLMVHSLRRLAEDAPAVDAAPVVHCYECKYFEMDTGFCDHWGTGSHCDDFCSRGARMDKEE